MKNLLITLSILIGCHSIWAQNSIDKKTLVYKFNIKQEIAPPVVRTTQNALKEAKELNADYILIHMNTYGGMVDSADSIRTRLLNSPIPVLVFIDNNAASAGALISIAADSIYMRAGGSFGAASVVNQQGELVPEKYQSYMRALMRSTAESHGKDTIIINNDTIYKWHRDPAIAEAMVDPRTYIEGIIDTGKVLTFSAEEALKYNYSEGIASTCEEVLEKAGITNYKITEYKPTALDSIIGFILNPFVHGILIMIIIGGIYFELQTPGVGFPIAAAITAAILYFAPLYLEGLVENWEVLLFIAGIGLITVEIFVLPGFGIAGISGIVLVIAGLTLALIDNVIFETNRELGISQLLRTLLFVSGATIFSIIGSILISKKMLKVKRFSNLILSSQQNADEGYVVNAVELKPMIGKTGKAYTMLRPSGKVIIENQIFDACCNESYIDKGTNITVISQEAAQLYVKKQ
ncbi:MAG: nodulation protein NfeD [Bacteroidales bacterium]|nr:nodulation protein NfeD [Bacteroidales bacterium]